MVATVGANMPGRQYSPSLSFGVARPLVAVVTWLRMLRSWPWLTCKPSLTLQRCVVRWPSVSEPCVKRFTVFGEGPSETLRQAFREHGGDDSASIGRVAFAKELADQWGCLAKAQ